MSAAELLALAKRCEAATGADRRIDGEIACLMRDHNLPDWAKRWEGPWLSDQDGRVTMMQTNGIPGPSFRANAYTASLDAAMGLVPEAHEWLVGWCGNSDALVSALPDGPECHGYGATPALALCAAALRARAAEGGAS